MPRNRKIPITHFIPVEILVNVIRNAVTLSLKLKKLKGILHNVILIQSPSISHKIISVSSLILISNSPTLYKLHMSVGPKVSGLTYKSRAKWKMLWRIYCAIYGEVNVSVSVCVEIKGDYIEK